MVTSFSGSTNLHPICCRCIQVVAVVSNCLVRGWFQLQSLDYLVDTIIMAKGEFQELSATLQLELFLSTAMFREDSNIFLVVDLDHPLRDAASDNPRRNSS